MSHIVFWRLIFLTATILLAAAGSLSAHARAVEPGPRESAPVSGLKFSCATEIPSTSVVARPSEDRLLVSVINHNGAKYMPIFDGLITAEDIRYVSEIASLLVKLGSQFNFSLPLSGCTTYPSGVFSCYGSDRVNMGGQEFDIASLTLAKTKILFQGYSFDRYDLSVGVNVNNRFLSIPMRYELRDCLFE